MNPSAPEEIGGTSPSFPEGTYVDFHVHVIQQWAGRDPLSAGAIVQWMDANDVSQAVVHPLVSPESYNHIITNDYVLEQTLPYRDRLIPFVAVDPRSPLETWGWTPEKMLRHYIDAGARGFGEHKPGVPIGHSGSMALYEACGELGLCVMFHLDSYRNTDEAGLPGLERVLNALPHVNFVGHGLGFWASISGDVRTEEFQSYPKGKVAPNGAVPRLLEKYPNLYGDLSANSGNNAITRDRDFGRDFIIRFADKLLWGTDYQSHGHPLPQLTIYPNLDLPDDVQRKVNRDNARRLIGML